MELLSRDEATPAAYPNAPSGASDVAWARVERFIAWRWSARTVTWIVQGPGEWSPDLTPATVSATEKWVSNAWEAVSLDASWNGGYELESGTVYRFTATVGDQSPEDVPAEVQEAVTRVDAFLTETDERPGAGSYSVKIGEIEESWSRTGTWKARALHMSGAADLLRKYRRVPGSC